jgi:hypothetical protein
MAFAKGTATNFADLFSRFVDFLSNDPSLVAAGQNAQVVFRSAPANWDGKVLTSVQREHVVFKQPGLAGNDQIFSSLTSFGDTAQDYYNWKINGAVGFNGAGLGANYPNLDQGLIGGSPSVGALLWNQAMPYWFFATGRRWWIVVKVSTIYTSLGAGFLLPACPPSQFPYPMAVWAGYPNSADRWSSSTDYHRGITTPNYRSMYMRAPGGRWADFYGGNQYSTPEVPGGEYRKIHPVGVSSLGGAAYDRVVALRDSPGNKFPLIPVTLFSFGPEGTNTFGEADGLFFVPVLNNGAEDEIVIGGVTYIIFQSGFRSGSPFLFALRVDA